MNNTKKLQDAIMEDVEKKRPVGRKKADTSRSGPGGSTLHVRLDPEDRKRIQEFAERKGLKVSSAVRMIIRERLSEEGF